MANIKSAIRRIKVTKRNHDRNQGVKSELKTLVKSVRQKPDATMFLTTQKNLAKAAAKGIIHKKQAARRTARLAKNLAKANAAPVAAAPKAKTKTKAKAK